MADGSPRRRLRACVEAWPECAEGLFDPNCCRFPKSCSCDVYDPEQVTDADLEEPQHPSPDTGDTPERPLGACPVLFDRRRVQIPVEHDRRNPLTTTR